MSYNFNEIEKKWQKFWAENKVFKAHNDSALPKYYVLDMKSTMSHGWQG